MDFFSFDSIDKNNPLIKLEGLIVPFEINKEQTNQKFNSGKSSICFFRDGSIHFEENDALSFLLRKGFAFINNHWWKSSIKKHEFHTLPENPWPEQACDTFSINVNCNDLFEYACADAEELFYTDLETLYAHVLVDNRFGSLVWCIKKRKCQPQRSLFENIQKAGVWDLNSFSF